MALIKTQTLRTRGIALPFVLLILTLLLVAVSAVAHQGLGTLHQAKLEQFKKQALFAAEAGAADAVERLVEDSNFPGPVGETEMSIGAEYEAEITNNLNGTSGPLTASNGVEVPQGYAYVFATGSVGTVSRRVGVLLTKGSASALGIAVGVGGSVDMSGNKRITGSIKANGSIKFSGNTGVIPLDGSGRVLSSDRVNVSGNTRVDDTQDVLARTGVNGNIRGAYEIVGNDSSVATQPFIVDYRTDNALLSGESGSVLPNPDQALLLAPGPNFVNHDDGTGVQPEISATLNLGGKIHYYPNGVKIRGDLIGPGTVVSGGGNPIEFSGNNDIAQVNLVALAPPPSEPPGNGNASINFSGNTHMSGLLYAHHGVNISGNARVTGVVIAYDPVKGNLDTSGNNRITLDSTVLSDIPGFEPWANGFGGLSGAPTGDSIGVVIWEQM